MDRPLRTWHPVLAPYVVLISSLVEGRLSGEEFETLFFVIFSSDKTMWSTAAFSIMDRFFQDVDDFVVDDKLREEVGGSDELSLKIAAREVLSELNLLDLQGYDALVR